jgi:hypothetical protein
MSTASFIVPLLIQFGIVVGIILAIAAIMEGRNNMRKSSVIRSLYFYLASVITLAIAVGSLIFLVNLGFKSWVFTEADQGPSVRLGPPPTLYLADTTGSVVPTKDVAVLGGKLECDEECTLTDSQKNTISTWKTSYQDWISGSANPGSQRARDAVVALSFLIVSLPFYLIHFRVVQREWKQEADQERSVIRPTYFYFVALAALIMMVVAGGFLINLGLKTWVFPSAGQADKLQTSTLTPIMATPEGEAVKSMVSCGSACGLDQETVDLANRWQIDYDAWNAEISQNVNNTQRQAATSIPFVLVGIPLFWYHWSVVRKESREKKEQTSQPIQKV